ncbi:hypothetical protein MMC30_007023 [Trapelia coarctata]|nr:hypothetical protein [Trapelia coarctata]
MRHFRRVFLLQYGNWRSYRYSPVASSRDLYWQKISRWKNVDTEAFLTYKWQTANSVQNSLQLYNLLASVLPERVLVALPSQRTDNLVSATDFIEDVREGVGKAPMSIRITPHILSAIDWQNPVDDPLRRQFVPLGSQTQLDHPKLSLDSLSETEDSPVKGLVYRYSDKALFLGLFTVIISQVRV